MEAVHEKIQLTAAYIRALHIQVTGLGPIGSRFKSAFQRAVAQK
jgi:hypothetical protein